MPFMGKINYHKRELELADRLLRIIESERVSRQPSRRSGRVTNPATDEQLRLLSKHGIRPLWYATEHEAQEMIMHYKAILSSVSRRP